MKANISFNKMCGSKSVILESVFKYITKIVVQVVGYLNIMDLSNARKMEQIKSVFFCAHWKETEPVFYAAMKREILCPACCRTTLTQAKWENLVINCREIVFPGSTISRDYN
jgi:hypothetical protein